MAMVVVELFGFMGLFSIKLNAIPAVILIVTVGVSLQFIIYITMVNKRHIFLGYAELECYIKP